MSNLLNFLEDLSITPRRASVADGGEYHSLCPTCGDGGKGRESDRFHIWPEKENKNGLCVGRFWCRQCGISGDTIEFLMKFHNLSFAGACAQLGIKLEGNNSTGYRVPKTPRPPVKSEFQPRTYPLPAQLWSQRAAAFVEDCHNRLLNRPDALAWLAERGVCREAVKEFRLGYNESSKGGDRYRPRSVWGLQEKVVDGKTKKLWLPKGWVIPAMTIDDIVFQLRIRRTNEDIARFAPDVKYLMIQGSSPATMVLHPLADVFAVVECGFDAILIAMQMEGKVGAVTTWNSSARPDLYAHSVLQGSDCILNALDFDKAGGNEQLWWRDTYRQNRRWPVPVGKDPGDAFKSGVDIGRWLLAGMPKGLAERIGGVQQQEALPVEKVREPEKQQDVAEVVTDREEKISENQDSTGGEGGYGSDIEELKALLAESNGFFRIYDHGNGIGPEIDKEWSERNKEKRKRITNLLYVSDEVNNVISRLEDGMYNHITLPA